MNAVEEGLYNTKCMLGYFKHMPNTSVTLKRFTRLMSKLLELPENPNVANDATVRRISHRGLLLQPKGCITTVHPEFSNSIPDPRNSNLKDSSRYVQGTKTPKSCAFGREAEKQHNRVLFYACGIVFFLAGSFSSDVESQSTREGEGGWDRGFAIPIPGVDLVHTLLIHMR
jgi:hypothetical protein